MSALALAVVVSILASLVVAMLFIPLAASLLLRSESAREAARGGLAPDGPKPAPAERKVTLCQRKEGRPGKGLGKTTGWIHRRELAMRGVEAMAGVTTTAANSFVGLDGAPQEGFGLA